MRFAGQGEAAHQRGQQSRRGHAAQRGRQPPRPEIRCKGAPCRVVPCVRTQGDPERFGGPNPRAVPLGKGAAGAADPGLRNGHRKSRRNNCCARLVPRTGWYDPGSRLPIASTPLPVHSISPTADSPAECATAKALPVPAVATRTAFPTVRYVRHTVTCNGLGQVLREFAAHSAHQTVGVGQDVPAAPPLGAQEPALTR